MPIQACLITLRGVNHNCKANEWATAICLTLLKSPALTQERRWIWQPLGRDTSRRISLRMHEAKNYFANTSCKVFKVIVKVLAETLPIFFANRTLSTARI